MIELLVVVGILVLLMAILLPSLTTARQRARRLLCGSHLRSVGHALNLYRTGLGRYPWYGDTDPAGLFGPFWNPSLPRPTRPVDGLDGIGDLARALVKSSLGAPWSMYCPSSLANDIHAPKPYETVTKSRKVIATWMTGQISYMYLPGLDYRSPATSFPGTDGKPTYVPTKEAPDRTINRVNSRAVLIGDRTVEIIPPNKNIPGSNHDREGGWFYFTSGDARWFDWSRLTAHPTSIYVWYWPRIGPPPPS